MNYTKFQLKQQLVNFLIEYGYCKGIWVGAPYRKGFISFYLDDEKFYIKDGISEYISPEFSYTPVKVWQQINKVLALFKEYETLKTRMEEIQQEVENL